MKKSYYLAFLFLVSTQVLCQRDSINRNAITLHIFDMPQVVGVGYHRLLTNPKSKIQVELANSLSRATASGKLDSEYYLHYGVVPTVLFGNKTQVRPYAGIGAFLQQDFAEEPLQNIPKRAIKYRVLPHGRLGLRFDKPKNLLYFSMGISTGFIREETNVFKEPDQLWFKTSYLLFLAPGTSIGIKF